MTCFLPSFLQLLPPVSSRLLQPMLPKVEHKPRCWAENLNSTSMIQGWLSKKESNVTGITSRHIEVFPTSSLTCRVTTQCWGNSSLVLAGSELTWTWSRIVLNIIPCPRTGPDHPAWKQSFCLCVFSLIEIIILGTTPTVLGLKLMPSKHCRFCKLPLESFGSQNRRTEPEVKSKSVGWVKDLGSERIRMPAQNKTSCQHVWAWEFIWTKQFKWQLWS